MFSFVCGNVFIHFLTRTPTYLTVLGSLVDPVLQNFREFQADQGTRGTLCRRVVLVILGCLGYLVGLQTLAIL